MKYDAVNATTELLSTRIIAQDFNTQCGHLINIIHSLRVSRACVEGLLCETEAVRRIIIIL